MTTKGSYDHPTLPLSLDYIYDEGEPETGIPASVEIVAIWHKGVDLSDLILEINTGWVATMEDKIKQTKTLI